MLEIWLTRKWLCSITSYWSDLFRSGPSQLIHVAYLWYINAYCIGIAREGLPTSYSYSTWTEHINLCEYIHKYALSSRDRFATTVPYWCYKFLTEPTSWNSGVNWISGIYIRMFLEYRWKRVSLFHEELDYMYINCEKSLMDYTLSFSCLESN